jgi:hypothetical protein
MSMGCTCSFDHLGQRDTNRNVYSFCIAQGGQGKEGVAENFDLMLQFHQKLPNENFVFCNVLLEWMIFLTKTMRNKILLSPWHDRCTWIFLLF